MLFLHKKPIHAEKIRDLNDAIGAIKTFIYTEEWEKGYHGIKEIREKEKDALYQLLSNPEIDEKIKNKERRRFDTNMKIFSKLEGILRAREQKWKEKISLERFKMKFQKIEEEINLLTKTHKHIDALTLLNSFVDEYKENYLVIKFYDKEKNIIKKNIERERKKEEDSIRKSTRLEAMKLIGKTIATEEEKDEKIKEKWQKVEGGLLKKLSFYKNILEKRKKKKLIDEVMNLIETDNEAAEDIARSKLAKVHQWLVKELTITNINGYDFYGKILGADKISWDSFGFYENDKKYDFYLWDATGHGVRAGLIVSLLTRLFNQFANGRTLSNLVYEINNGLKQDLQSRNFITWIFFEIEKEKKENIQFVWMGHEPMFIFREKTGSVEKVIPGWLAAWIRIIPAVDHVKVKDIIMEDNDILLTFSDGIVEAKNIDNQLLWIDNFKQIFERVANKEKNITKIYTHLMDEVKLYRGWAKFDDDSTIILLKRTSFKDIITEKDAFLDKVAEKENLSGREIKKMVGKTKEEAEVEIQKIKKEKETRNIIKILEWLYYTGEILKLKQEAIRFIKEWYIHRGINKYLKLAIANENKYRIEQKNRKMEWKYNILTELMKKWDYKTVIEECNDIIAKDGNI